MVMAHHTGFPILGKYFGFTACSLFFVISGYGLTKSMNNKEWNNVHLIKSLKKLISPYLLFWGLSIVSLALFKYISIDNLFEFLTFGFPNLTGWFYRTIIVLYIVYFFVRKLKKFPHPDCQCCFLSQYI